MTLFTAEQAVNGLSPVGVGVSGALSLVLWLWSAAGSLAGAAAAGV